MADPRTLDLFSWNVNGLRAVLKKGFLEYVDRTQPDILCLQETKAQPDQVDLDIPGYQALWNSAEKKGYSGVLTLTRHEPEEVVCGMGQDEHDREGRVIRTTFPDFHLLNVYTPNSQNELRRLPYRQQQWDPAFREHVNRLQEDRPVIFCGDLNVAHQEIDLANPKSNRRNAGFTDEERAGFSALVEDGFIDTFREFNQDPGHYSWWSYRGGARARNVGWRIDYVCISPALRPHLSEAFIQPEVMGSDHCPVGIRLTNL